jgi:ABC-type amino acid transport substrate-binding protein
MKLLFKKMYLIIYNLFLFSFIFSHFQIKAELPSDIKHIIARGKLIVAVNSVDYPPFFYHNKDNKLEGYDIDIAHDIAKYLGIAVEFNQSANTFKGVVNLVENDKADLAISAISGTLTRGLIVRFSDPYVTPNQSLILNRILEVQISNHNKIAPSKAKIAILNNSSYEDFAKQNYDYFKKNFGDFSFVKYDSLDQAFSDVLDGNILGLYVDEIYANYMTYANKKANIFTHKRIVQEAIDPISIAVNWKNPNLAYWVNLYIRRMKFNGKEKILYNKYLRDKK